jgi:hypothetical protein
MLRCGVGGSLLPLIGVESQIARNCEGPLQMNAKRLFDLTGRVAIVSGGSMGLGLPECRPGQTSLVSSTTSPTRF